MKIQVTALIVASCLLAACGETSVEPDAESVCTSEMRDDVYAPMMSKTGQSGWTVVLVAADPAPPARFYNTWSVQVRDDLDAPRDDATVTVTPWMPDHSHGTGTPAIVTADGADGMFEITPIDLWMPGLWEVRIAVLAGGDGDNVVFAFCVSE